MWSKLDDELLTHPKVDVGGKLLGEDGRAIAIGFYAICLMWANKNLTDGFIPESSMENLHYVKKPLTVAGALVRAGFLERVDGGFQIHDFHDHNPSARDIKKKRKDDREAKRAARANGAG